MGQLKFSIDKLESSLCFSNYDIKYLEDRLLILNNDVQVVLLINFLVNFLILVINCDID